MISHGQAWLLYTVVWQSWIIVVNHIILERNCSLCVYTDGAASLSRGWPRVVKTAGWAVVVFAKTEKQEHVLPGVLASP